MKNLVVVLFLIPFSYGLSAQFKYGLSNYKSNIRVRQSFDKNIILNDIIVDTVWFFDYHLTNTKVFPTYDGARVANTKETHFTDFIINR